LAVGALVAYKRYDLAIEAARRLDRRLVLVGRGPEERRLRVLAPPSVEFLQGASPERLRDLYRGCASYLQPGEEDFGIAAVEALACGAPVVALGKGGARDIVRDGVNGVLYEGDTADALAEAVRRADRVRFDYTDLRASAMPFQAERFAAAFSKAVGEILR
jgi:glycosyltransferase involved in cell wall biosynthesis